MPTTQLDLSLFSDATNQATDDKESQLCSIQYDNLSPHQRLIGCNHQYVADGSFAQNNAKNRKNSWIDAAYNYNDDEYNKSPIYMAIYNMLVPCGIVGIPIQIKQSGIIPGLMLMAIVAVFSTYTLRLLIKNGKKVKVCNYECLCKKCWGIWGYVGLSVL